jgi:hypothetical protein
MLIRIVRKHMDIGYPAGLDLEPYPYTWIFSWVRHNDTDGYVHGSDFFICPFKSASLPSLKSAGVCVRVRKR